MRPMSMLFIPDDLKQRLDTAAAARGISADELATEVLTAAVPTPPDTPRPLSFIGIGNSGRNAFRGPVFTNLDMSLIKKFKITENHAVTFRAEAYNLPNHAAFATPSGTNGSTNLNTPATFGKFASTIGGTTRTMQMALRYDF